MNKTLTLVEQEMVDSILSWMVKNEFETLGGRTVGDHILTWRMNDWMSIKVAVSNLGTVFSDYTYFAVEELVAIKEFGWKQGVTYTSDLPRHLLLESQYMGTLMSKVSEEIMAKTEYKRTNDYARIEMARQIAESKS